MSERVPNSLVLLKLTDDEQCNIRGTRLENGEYGYSVYDFTTKACGYKDAGATARKEFARLTKEGSEFKLEIAASCHSIHFPGQRGPGTPAMTIRGLQRLLMILGGKVASEFRKVVERTFTQVMAGDTSLIEVINANAASNAPLQTMYRESLAREAADASMTDDSGEEDARVVNRRKMKREEIKWDLDVTDRRLAIAERKERLKMLAADAHTKVVEVQKLVMTTYADLCPNKEMDDRARLMFKDNVMNAWTQEITAIISHDAGSVSQPTQIAPDAIGNGHDTSNNMNKPLTISSLASGMGKRFSSGDIQKIGKRVIAAYRNKYNDEVPSKHEQFVDGAVRSVNSYTERDRAMIEGIISNYGN